ncbi:MAG: S8 family peptidase, partial [Planctomycetota bacterium]
MAEQAGSCADPPSPVWHGVEQLESRLLLSVAPGSIQFAPADELALSGPLVQPAQAGPLSKLTTPLAALFAEHQVWERGSGGAGFMPGNPLVRVSGGSVVIDAVASGDAAALLADLEALGLAGAASSGPVVSGRFPLTALDELAALESLNFASPAMALANAGATTSQGDVAMRADEARSAFGVDGTGVKVGVLSDSFDTSGSGSYAADQQSGDLPPGVQVLSEYAGGTDEGRAIMQLVHDVAPGAELAFHTAFNGMADFADGIVGLAQAGADVIVDDVIYFAEPMFQDGIIAQAVDTVVEGGVWNGQPVAGGAAYFSSAGNQATRGYESAYVNSGEALIVSDIFRGYLHDFDPGPGVDYQQSILLPDGAGITVSLQWDQPFASVGGAGASSNLDVYLVATDTMFGPAVVAEGITANIGGDAVELVQFVNTFPAIYGTSFDLLITHYQGPEAVQMKYVWFPIVVSGAAVLEYNTYDGSLFGHANAAGAEAVGAAFYGDTPEYGVDPPVMEWYTSAGPTLILFDTDGNRLADEDGDGLPGITRKKPGIVAPDGTNTTFFGTDTDGDGFPNFYGTSAAAPHAAAVAALMLHADPSLTPGQTYTALEATAVNMSPRFGYPEDPDGFDFDTGYGLVDALAAVGAVAAPDTTPPTVTVNSPNGGEDWVVGSVHDITWSAGDDVGVSSVDLHYSSDGAASFVEIATGQANDGLYGWTVPDDAGT